MFVDAGWREQWKREKMFIMGIIRVSEGADCFFNFYPILGRP
jgi:hypothetical protein